MRKNAFLTFVFAFLPGCGQMYQGYMRRGFSLLAWFCGVLGVSLLTRVYVLNFLLPVIWAYSFFDTFNIRALSPEQRTSFADDFIPNAAWLQKHKLAGLLSGGRAGKIAGGVFIGIGLLMLYQNFYQNVYYFIGDRFPSLMYLFNALPAFLIGVAVIIIGIWMLRRQRKTLDTKEEDIPPFTGGENHEQ